MAEDHSLHPQLLTPVWVVGMCAVFKAGATVSNHSPPTLHPCAYPQIITCFFIISTEPWNTMFELWNKTCLEGHLHGSVG